MQISILIPVLDIEERLEDTIKAIREITNAHIVLVCDITKNEIRENVLKHYNKLEKKYNNVKYFFRPVGTRGFGSAIIYGIDKLETDYFIVMMGDLCDDPRSITMMIEELKKGSDIVAGCRYMRGGGIVGNSIKQRVSFFVSFLINIFSKIKCKDISNAYKAYNRKIFDKNIVINSNSFDISCEIVLKAFRKGYRVSQVPTVWKNRDLGNSKFNFSKEAMSYFRWFVFASVHMPSLLTKTILLFLILSPIIFYL